MKDWVMGGSQGGGVLADVHGVVCLPWSFAGDVLCRNPILPSESLGDNGGRPFIGSSRMIANIFVTLFQWGIAVKNFFWTVDGMMAWGSIMASTVVLDRNKSLFNPLFKGEITKSSSIMRIMICSVIGLLISMIFSSVGYD